VRSRRHIDGERVRFVGEVSGTAKRSLFAHARGLLMPIRWEEPFGMVMVEALACGTPVIAFAEGAARELVVDGRTGFLVADERAMAAAVGQLPRIDAARLPRLGRRELRRRRRCRRVRGDVPVGARSVQSLTGARACLSGRSACWTAAPSSSATASATCSPTRAASTGSSRGHALHLTLAPARRPRAAAAAQPRPGQAFRSSVLPDAEGRARGSGALLDRAPPLVDHVWMEEITSPTTCTNPAACSS
jgi:hypothetical protein